MLYSLPVVLFVLAQVVGAVGERTLVGAPARLAQGTHAIVVVLALLLGAIRAMRAKNERKQALWRVWRSLGIATLGIGLHVAIGQQGQALWVTLLGPTANVVWPLLLVWGIGGAAAQQYALKAMQHAPTIEMWRVARAARAVRIIMLSIVSFAAINYAAHTYNRKVDLSYFRTTQVGEASRNLVQGLGQSLTLSLFFPPANDVQMQVLAYCEALAALSPWVTLENLDQALEPDKARNLKVRHNGVIALHTATRTELIEVDLDVEDARATLRRLDSEIYRRLVAVIKPTQVVYVTQGHNEPDINSSLDKTKPALRDFRMLMETQGYVVRSLGLGEGLGRDVPHDASVVAIMGPTVPFSPVERQAIARYVARGGHLLICLDPDRDSAEDALLAPLGVTIGRERLANTHYQVRAENQAQSPYNLVTVRLSGHPSVATLEKNPGRMGLVLLGASYVHVVNPEDPNRLVTATAHPMPDTFIDSNRNGVLDAPSERATHEALAVAITGPEPEGTQAINPHPERLRAIVVGDVDLALDGVVRNPGNGYFLTDALHWLAEGDAPLGTLASEEDVPMVQRKEEDAIWFYGISFGVPLAVICMGLVVRRRDRTRLRKVLGSRKETIT